MLNLSDYEPMSTGGGFVAMFRNVGPVNIWLTCAADESRLPTPGERVDVGFYDAETLMWLQSSKDEDYSNLTPEEADLYIQNFLSKQGIPT